MADCVAKVVLRPWPKGIKSNAWPIQQSRRPWPNRRLCLVAPSDVLAWPEISCTRGDGHDDQRVSRRHCFGRLDFVGRVGAANAREL